MPKVLAAVSLSIVLLAAGLSYAEADTTSPQRDAGAAAEHRVTPQQREWFRRTIEHMLDESSSVASRTRPAR